MDHKPLKQRKALRLKDYNYSLRGTYFITICVQNRECLFGKIINTKVGADPRVGPKADPRVGPTMILNDVGYMIESIWKQIPSRYPGVRIDEFIVMPNHIHGIIVLDGNTNDDGQTQGSAPTMTLSDVIQRFKSLTTTRYLNGIHQQNWLPFDGKLWQRNYYDHIVRDDEDLNRIRQYIIDNPLNWEEDSENKTINYEKIIF